MPRGPDVASVPRVTDSADRFVRGTPRPPAPARAGHGSRPPGSAAPPSKAKARRWMDRAVWAGQCLGCLGCLGLVSGSPFCQFRGIPVLVAVTTPLQKVFHFLWVQVGKSDMFPKRLCFLELVSCFWYHCDLEEEGGFPSTPDENQGFTSPNN